MTELERIAKYHAEANEDNEVLDRINQVIRMCKDDGQEREIEFPKYGIVLNVYPHSTSGDLMRTYNMLKD